ncbi:MAG: hypothetical protein KME57_15100 [Scytonema hyalinum WJT4-NPBG1]|jgi:hypothetical protein|nr:hypothetical protein [Scytonema hyalinum WJT4-NPBG1]
MMQFNDTSITWDAWKRYENQTASRVGESESEKTHSPLEQLSQKRKKSSQIANQGEKLVPTLPESASL